MSSVANGYYGTSYVLYWPIASGKDCIPTMYGRLILAIWDEPYFADSSDKASIRSMQHWKQNGCPYEPVNLGV